MDVSVTAVIPTTGTRPELLRDALLSVCAQIRAPEEILVVVDAPPSTRDRVEDMAAVLTERVRVVAVPGAVPVGASASRNCGARASRGLWLAFLDDDDLWRPDHLLRWQEHAGNTDVYLSAFEKLRADGTTLREKQPPARLHRRAFLVTNPGLRGSNLVIRAAHYAQLAGFDEDLPALNDLDLGVRLAALQDIRYARCMEPTVVFRAHEGSRVTSRAGESIRLGVERFWARHHRAMTSVERARFQERSMALWGIQVGGTP